MRLLKLVAGWVLAVVVLGAVAVAQNDDTPLGDVAREKPAKKAARTFDDDNFQRSVPAPASDSKAGDTAKPNDGQKADAKADAPAEDVKALEKQLADLKVQRETVASRITRMQEAAGNASDDSKENLAEAVDSYKERLKGIDAQIPVLEKKLEAARGAQSSGSSGGSDDSKKAADAKPDDTAPPKAQ